MTFISVFLPRLKSLVFEEGLFSKILVEEEQVFQQQYSKSLRIHNRNRVQSKPEAPNMDDIQATLKKQSQSIFIGISYRKHDKLVHRKVRISKHIKFQVSSFCE